jgi:hypothetical protein
MLIALVGDTTLAEYIMLPNIDEQVLQVALGLDGLFVTIGGVLMWKGPRIGWFYSILLFVASAVRNVAGFVLIEDVLDEFGMPADGIEFYFAEYVLRAVIAVACIPIFMTRPVTDFFGIDERRERGYVAVITALCIGLAFVLYFMRRMFV